MRDPTPTASSIEVGGWEKNTNKGTEIGTKLKTKSDKLKQFYGIYVACI